MDKQKQQIFESADEFKGYLEDDIKELQSVYEHLLTLQELSDGQLEALSTAVPGKGTQRYLVDHITNAIAIQSQIQSVLKDKRAIKENALQLAIKQSNGEDTGDSSAILAALQKVVNEQKIEKRKNKADATEKKITKTEAEIDAEIEERLRDEA